MAMAQSRFSSVMSFRYIYIRTVIIWTVIKNVITMARWKKIFHLYLSMSVILIFTGYEAEHWSTCCSITYKLL